MGHQLKKVERILRPFLTIPLLFILLTGCVVAPQEPQSLPTLVPTTFLVPVTETAVSTLPPTITHTPTNTPTPFPPTNTPIPPTPSPTRSAYETYLLANQTDQPLPYLERFRLVAYYGTPLGPALGILGNQPPEEMIAQLQQTTQIYAAYSQELTTLPTFHIIVTVADKTPPYYRHYLNDAFIEEWIALAESLGFAVILDIQPGHGSPLNEMKRLEQFLYHPHVHFAIDPEFVMDGNQVPGINLGQLYANDINAIQEVLNQIGAEIGVKKVLILHQFANKMLPDKENILDYPNVEVVIDGDGVGNAQTKINSYLRYANEPAFEFGGFKLFPTDGDFPVLTPDDVMNQLTPQPAIIIYQ